MTINRCETLRYQPLVTRDEAETKHTMNSDTMAATWELPFLLVRASLTSLEVLGGWSYSALVLFHSLGIPICEAAATCHQYPTDLPDTTGECLHAKKCV